MINPTGANDLHHPAPLGDDYVWPQDQLDKGAEWGMRRSQHPVGGGGQMAKSMELGAPKDQCGLGCPHPPHWFDNNLLWCVGVHGGGEEHALQHQNTMAHRVAILYEAGEIMDAEGDRSFAVGCRNRAFMIAAREYQPATPDEEQGWQEANAGPVIDEGDTRNYVPLHAKPDTQLPSLLDRAREVEATLREIVAKADVDRACEDCGEGPTATAHEHPTNSGLGHFYRPLQSALLNVSTAMRDSLPELLRELEAMG
jgi:hypothetical protein